MKLPQNIRCQCIVCIEQKFTHCVRVPKSRYYRRQFHRTRQIRRKKLHAGGFKKVLPKLANVTHDLHIYTQMHNAHLFSKYVDNPHAIAIEATWNCALGNSMKCQWMLHL